MLSDLFYKSSTSDWSTALNTPLNVCLSMLLQMMCIKRGGLILFLCSDQLICVITVDLNGIVLQGLKFLASTKIFKDKEKTFNAKKITVNQYKLNCAIYSTFNHCRGWHLGSLLTMSDYCHDKDRCPLTHGPTGKNTMAGALSMCRI